MMAGAYVMEHNVQGQSDRLLSPLKIVCFHTLKNPDKIVRFRPGSSALTQRSTALTKDRLLLLESSAFDLDRLF